RTCSPRRQRRPPDCGALGDEGAGGTGHTVWPGRHPGQHFRYKQIWASVLCHRLRGRRGQDQGRLPRLHAQGGYRGVHLGLRQLRGL
ncbi:unnamed protein product, partial [Phaeothamnion confervicola]